jgi:hypothetical protein
MTAISVDEGMQESSMPCSCVGPCAGYGTRSGCPSLLVMVTLIAAKDALAASLHGGAALIG